MLYRRGKIILDIFPAVVIHLRINTDVLDLRGNIEMVNTLDRAPLTGNILPIVKQSGVKELVGEMVKAGIIPEIQTTGYQNGVSGFIYYGEILDILHRHNFAIDCLISDYADTVGKSEITAIADIAQELDMESADKFDVVKTILAVDYLAVLMSEYGTVRANLTDSKGFEFDVENIEWDNFTQMRQSGNWDLLDFRMSRQTGGEFTIKVNEDTDITVISTEETDDDDVHNLETYTVNWYVQLSEYCICIL